MVVWGCLGPHRGSESVHRMVDNEKITYPYFESVNRMVEDEKFTYPSVRRPRPRPLPNFPPSIVGTFI